MRAMNRHHVAFVVVLALVWLGLAGTATAQSGLDKAYEKEFAHLEAQKRALKKRLKELETKTASSVEKAEKERDRLQGKLMSLQEKGDSLQKKLRTLDEESSSKGRGRDILRSTLEQAAATLEPHPVEFEPPAKDEKPDYATVLPELFAKAGKVVEQSRSIRSYDGKFFLPDGTKTDGEIIRIGNIAAYGIGDGVAGALAPAGKERLKLWKEDTAATAKAVASGEMPDTLKMFLFESLDEGVEQKKDETWLDTINSGGVIAWVIVALGVIGLLLVLGRALILGLAGANSRRVVRDVSEKVADGKLADAVEYCEEASGAASRVLASALENISRNREDLEDLVSESLLRETPKIERFGSAILVFAAVAPLLGLLGTVTGMISTFDVITEFGTGDPRMLSGGISEALVTTQLGLMVAIPLLLIGNLLKGWAERILGRLERGALRVMNLAELRQDGSSDPDGSVGASTPENDRENDHASEVLGTV